MATFENLPDEIVTIIFSNLSAKDRRNTKLVCQRFRKINAQLTLVKHDVTHVKKYSEINTYISPYAVHVKIKISLMDYKYKEEHKKFWKVYGAGIKSVIVDYWRNCDLKALVDILELCPNLKHLTVVSFLRQPHSFECCDCSDVFDLDLSHIVSLYLVYISCPKQLNRMLLTAKKVNTFQFNRTNQNYLLGNLVPFLSEQKPILEELQLHGFFNENELIEIFTVSSGPLLTKLSISALDYYFSDALDPIITDSVTTAIAKNMPNLKLLQIETKNDRYIEESSLIALINTLTKLNEIYLNTKLVTDACAAVLGEMLPNLSACSLFDCKLTEIGFEKLFANECLRMKWLELEHAENLTENCLLKMLNNFPNLTYLCLMNLKELSRNVMCAMARSKIESLQLN